MENPEISVVIPCYNSNKELLKNLLQSIYSQTYKNFEIIIVDDGSDIEHILILDELRKEYDFRLVLEKHVGVSHARNVGTKLSKGNYITYIDSDDCITNIFFEEAIKFISLLNVDYLIGGLTYSKDIVKNFNPIFINNKSEYQILTGDIKDKFKSCVLKPDFDNYKDIFFTGGPVARFLTKNLATEVGFNEKIHRHEDCIWNCQLIDKSKSLAIIFSHWYFVYMFDNSSTRIFNPNMYKYQIDAFNELSHYVNFNNDMLFYAFVKKAYSYLCAVYRYHYIFLTYEEKKILTSKLYVDFPWKLIGLYRTFKLSNLKFKIHCIMYRFRMFVFERMAMDIIYKLIGKR